MESNIKSTTTGKNEDFFALNENTVYSNGEEPILHKIRIKKKVNKISITVEWKDQGFGNQKGQIYLALLRDSNELERISLFGVAGHAAQTIEIDSLQDKLETEIKVNDRIIIQGFVGGGGGHQLFVNKFTFNVSYQNKNTKEGGNDNDDNADGDKDLADDDNDNDDDIKEDVEYDCDALTKDAECFMGIPGIDTSKRLTDNTFLREMYLLQKPATKMVLTMGANAQITGVQFDNIKCGTSSNADDVFEVTHDDGVQEFLMFKKIVMQFQYYEAPDAANMYWIHLSYIALYGMNGEKHEIGTLHDVGLEKWKVKQFREGTEVNVYYQKQVTAKGHLFIKGMAFHNWGISGIQVIHIGDYNDNKDLMYCFNDINSKDSQGLSEGISTKKFYENIFKFNIVNFENERIFKVFEYLVNRVAEWENKGSVFKVLPKFLKIVKNGLEGNENDIHSVFCINRFLSYVNNQEFGYHEYSHWFKSKMSTFGTNPDLNKNKFNNLCGIWGLVDDSCNTIKRINYYKPQFNVYTLTFFERSWSNYFSSILTFITQIFLFCVVISSIDYQNISNLVEHIQVLSIVVSLLISGTGLVLVQKQVRTHYAFVNTIDDASESKTDIWINLSFIVNVVISVLIIPLNLVILALTMDRFDLVLNVVAVLEYLSRKELLFIRRILQGNCIN